LGIFIELIEFLTLFNILFSEIIFSHSNFIQNQLNMIFFLFCIEYIIVLFLIFFLKLNNNFFKKSRINSIQKFTDHLSKTDILWDDKSFVMTKLLMIIDFVHGESRYLFSLEFIMKSLRYFNLNSAKKYPWSVNHFSFLTDPNSNLNLQMIDFYVR